jgi:hypothetical protein
MVHTINKFSAYEKQAVCNGLLEILNSQVSTLDEIKNVFRSIRFIIDSISDKRTYSFILFNLIPWKLEGYELYINYSFEEGSKEIDWVLDQKFYTTILKYINNNIANHGDIEELASLIFLFFTQLGLSPTIYAEIYSKYNGTENMMSNIINRLFRYDNDVIGILSNVISDRDFCSHCSKVLDTNLKRELTESKSNYAVFGDNIIPVNESVETMMYRLRDLLDGDIVSYIGNTQFTTKLTEKQLAFVKTAMINEHAVVCFDTVSMSHLVKYDDENVYLLFAINGEPNKIRGISLWTNKDDQGEYRNLMEINIDDADYKLKVGDEFDYGQQTW